MIVQEICKKPEFLWLIFFGPTTSFPTSWSNKIYHPQNSLSLRDIACYSDKCRHQINMIGNKKLGGNSIRLLENNRSLANESLYRVSYFLKNSAYSPFHKCSVMHHFFLYRGFKRTRNCYMLLLLSLFQV